MATQTTDTIASQAGALAEQAGQLAQSAQALAEQAASSAMGTAAAAGAGHGGEFWWLFTVFVLACFIGFYVVWSVTPALHSPLMGVTNAISSVIIVGALIAAGPAEFTGASWLGLGAVLLASINIFGGFIVTERMLAMFKKKKS
ncbi:NAD(P) transhydrogenase subunit alpha [Roseospira marina]|uniref:proton-translocating NAD(P)(+) transhydrogenase n=1 Tax=Roseospira marina TaxID=140057 RepID=A0A5M6IHP3_9PROT|nr:NAD(P) transhydrogenase subunit alpha [Roseospira marina]KAA5607467.1 NAD(P) transhydrogenase subunit alpha [Roseospira marina]MBB4312353.1 NAD(P) transhydrogenase subunit alpha [Roseospira marina]MBB5085631.1 NAD(P) transhydrogenase subunit alpha [Roseospira marina]